MTSTEDQTGPAPSDKRSGAARMFGDIAPGLSTFTDAVLFGQVWTRPELSPRDRSLVTVAALTAGGDAEQLTYHLGLAPALTARPRPSRSRPSPTWRSTPAGPGPCRP
jgi:alkylhydroperoxidase/carboxymuconolactone decarboxylase family protein YurZ